MMKNSPRFLTVLLVLAMLICLFSACGSTSDVASEPAASEAVSSEAPAEEAQPENPSQEPSAPEETGEEVPEEAPAPSGEHKTIAEVAPDIPMDLPLTTEDVTFTYFTTLNPQITGYMSDLSENLYYKTAKERTGVNIEFKLASPDTQTENFNLMIAGGEYTDIIGSEGSSYAGGVENAVLDEVYVNINDYEEYAPHYFELLNRPEYNKADMLTDNGYMAGFGILYTEEQPLNQGYQIRQDWLDNLGLDTPVTYDQWHDVLASFKESYDCAPLALSSFSISGLSAGFGVYGDVSRFSTPIYAENGEVKFALIQDGYRDYVQLMSGWFAEGLLNEDELLNSAPFPDEASVLNNQLGIWKVERDNMAYYPGVANDPDFRCVAIPYPVMNEGDTTHFKELTTIQSTPALFLTTACEDIPLLVQWVDYRYSKEGATLANYGTEGNTFEFDADGNPSFTEMITANPDGMTSSLAMNVFTLWRCECLYDAYRMNSTFTDDQKDAPAIWSTNSDSECTMPSVTLTAEEDEKASSIYSDISTYAAENIVKFINGSNDMANYDSFVDTLNSMGVDEFVSIYQDAYDRYMAR